MSFVLSFRTELLHTLKRDLKQKISWENVIKEVGQRTKDCQALFVINMINQDSFLLDTNPV